MIAQRAALIVSIWAVPPCWLRLREFEILLERIDRGGRAKRQERSTGRPGKLQMEQIESGGRPSARTRARPREAAKREERPLDLEAAHGPTLLAAEEAGVLLESDRVLGQRPRFDVAT